MVFAYYPGCTMSTTAQKLDRYARLCASTLGFSLQELPSWQCCGAVFPLGDDEIAPKLPALRALKAAQDMGLPLVTLCAACFHVIKQVNHLAKNDKDFTQTVQKYDSSLVYTGGTQVLHYIQVLKQHIGFKELRKHVVAPLTGQSIGAYYGCMLLRPSTVLEFDDPENPTIIEELLHTLGANAAVFPQRNECCGSYHGIKNTPLVRQRVCKVINSATAHGANRLVTACPLCHYNLVSNTGNLRIEYFTQVLAQALGIKGDEMHD